MLLYSVTLTYNVFIYINVSYFGHLINKVSKMYKVCIKCVVLCCSVLRCMCVLCVLLCCTWCSVLCCACAAYCFVLSVHDICLSVVFLRMCYFVLSVLCAYVCGVRLRLWLTQSDTPLYGFLCGYRVRII